MCDASAWQKLQDLLFIYTLPRSYPVSRSPLLQNITVSDHLLRVLWSSNIRVSFIYYDIVIWKPGTQLNNHIPLRCVLPSIKPHQSNRKSHLAMGSLQIRLQHLVNDAPLASPSLQSPNRELHRWKWGTARDSITLEAKLQVPSNGSPSVTCFVLRWKTIKGPPPAGLYCRPVVRSLPGPRQATAILAQQPLLGCSIPDLPCCWG